MDSQSFRLSGVFSQCRPDGPGTSDFRNPPPLRWDVCVAVAAPGPRHPGPPLCRGRLGGLGTRQRTNRAPAHHSRREGSISDRTHPRPRCDLGRSVRHRCLRQRSALHEISEHRGLLTFCSRRLRKRGQGPVARSGIGQCGRGVFQNGSGRRTCSDIPARLVLQLLQPGEFQQSEQIGKRRRIRNHSQRRRPEDPSVSIEVDVPIAGMFSNEPLLR